MAKRFFPGPASPAETTGETAPGGATRALSAEELRQTHERHLREYLKRIDDLRPASLDDHYAPLFGFIHTCPRKTYE